VIVEKSLDRPASGRRRADDRLRQGRRDTGPFMRGRGFDGGFVGRGQETRR
jgi:hypothetical protein